MEKNELFVQAEKPDYSGTVLTFPEGTPHHNKLFICVERFPLEADSSQEVIEAWMREGAGQLKYLADRLYLPAGTLRDKGVQAIIEELRQSSIFLRNMNGFIQAMKMK